MIWLSRLLLDPRSRAVQRDLGDCQALHRTIMAAYPRVSGDAEGARARHGVLFRLDQPARGPRPLTLLVQSTADPDWSSLPAGYLLDLADGSPSLACKRVDERYATIERGAVLRFRLRANATRKIDTRSGPDGARRNGKRVDLRGDAERIAWLQRKADQGGFRLLTVGQPGAVAVRTTGDDLAIGYRPDSRASTGGARARLTFGAVLFDGLLCVADPEQFRDTLVAGIGPAKAYGFGLLSIARPDSPP